MSSLRLEKWEEIASGQASVFVPFVKRCLECKTGWRWIVSHDVCGLDWVIEARCIDCPRDSCMRVGSKQEWINLIRVTDTFLMTVNEIVDEFLSFCKVKCNGGHCWKDNPLEA